MPGPEQNDPGAAAEAYVEETAELYRRYLNPTMPNLIKFMGYGAVARSARGMTIIDSEGSEWLDFLGGLGVFSLGHSHPRVVAAVREQLERLPLTVPVLYNRAQAELAERLAALTPGAIQYTFFCSSGTEAVEGALKLARARTGRQGVVSAERAFHGKTLGSLSASGRELYKKPFEPLVPGFRQVPFGDARALEAVVTEETAAVILEPIQGEGGVILPPDDYLPRVREICTARGALLIADEVQTGLGRTGTMFAVEQYRVEPDIICLAKALGGGVMALGAFCGTPSVWEPFRPSPWLHTSTFGSPGGNPMACAAGLAALAVVEEERLADRAAELGAYFLTQLQAVQAEFLAGLVIAGMARRRIIVAYYLSNPRVFRFEPPLIVEREQIDRAIAAFRESVAEALALLEGVTPLAEE
jgi:putrescine aminotransferase